MHYIVQENSMTLDNPMWGDGLYRIAKARVEADALAAAGDTKGSYTTMLSAYVTVIPSLSLLGKIIHFPDAVKVASKLRVVSAELNHNQLDVLTQFYLDVYNHQIARYLFFLGLYPLREELGSLIDREIRLATSALDQKRGKPHQLALAYMVKASFLRRFHPEKASRVSFYVGLALGQEDAIRKEESLLALRQLTRIFRKAGELWIPDDRQRAHEYLSRALELASGEARTSDQVQKIRAILHTIEE